MKRYEEPTKLVLPRRTYTILRVDGRAFHTWTRGLAKPYDAEFMSFMDQAALALCEGVSGTQFAYVQSDEVSVLAVDFLDTETQPWFDGNVQKWSSVAAAIATQRFNEYVAALWFDRLYNKEEGGPISRKPPTALFDARVFTIPDLIEVENYFVWRQLDAERNSVMMLARAYASHKQLAGKNRAAQHDVIHKAGDNWAKHPTDFKHGRMVVREQTLPPSASRPLPLRNWVVDHDTPVFTKDREYLRGRIPVIWNDDLLVRKAAANG